MKKSLRIEFFILLLTIVSCSRYGDVRSTLRSAGDNRGELETVIRHYRQSGDRLKTKAALFLIGNMETAYSAEGPSLELYYTQLEEFYRREETDIFSLRAFNDSLFASGAYFNDLIKIYDAGSISADYLIHHIDGAFEAWNSPWAKDMDFESFCEYLLPYRIGNEVIEDWRSDFKDYYGTTFENLISNGNADAAEFCRLLNSVCHEQHTYSRYPSNKPTLKPSALKPIKGGSCNDYSVLFMAIARTFGIPVAAEFTPQWGNHSQGHDWCAVIEADGTTRHYSIGEPLFPERGKDFTWRLVKAYRRTASEQKEAIASSIPLQNLPKQLRNRRLKDVTDRYVPVTDISVRLPEYKSSYGKGAFLAVFDDKNWIPVCGTKVKRNLATFGNMGYPCVYLPLYFIDGKEVPATPPILVDSNRTVHILKADSNRLRTVHLKRKFMDLRALQFVDSLRGGHFELSSDPKFRNAISLEIPDDITFNYQTLSIDADRHFRYIRYVPKSGSCGNIAEIEVYGKDGVRLDGEIIGTYVCEDANYTMEKAFDGQTLSYAICQASRTDQWIGLDLGKATGIDRICYLPRSDDNFIRDGEEYELCYWDGEWVSLGRRIGSRETQELVYDNVPENALLLLHNHTKGKEERIFTYENGRQIWW